MTISSPRSPRRWLTSAPRWRRSSRTRSRPPWRTLLWHWRTRVKRSHLPHASSTASSAPIRRRRATTSPRAWHPRWPTTAPGSRRSGALRPAVGGMGGARRAGPGRRRAPIGRQTVPRRGACRSRTRRAGARGDAAHHHPARRSDHRVRTPHPPGRPTTVRCISTMRRSCTDFRRASLPPRRQGCRGRCRRLPGCPGTAHESGQRHRTHRYAGAPTGVRRVAGAGGAGQRFDTRALIAQIVALRARRAELLGYPDHAAYVVDEGDGAQRRCRRGFAESTRRCGDPRRGGGGGGFAGSPEGS